MSSSSRLLFVVVACAAMLSAGLVGPAAGDPAPDLPPTVNQRLDGLPAATRGSQTSKPVATPIPFSMVGFQVPDGARLEFRTATDGGAWTPWTAAEVEPDEGPDPDSAEGLAATPNISAPVWVGEASRLQTRVRGSGASARPENVGVHLVDSSGLGRSWGRRLVDRFQSAWRGTPPAAMAAPSRPGIVTRAQWGANESWRKGGPVYASSISMSILHHTAGSNTYTRDQADDVVRGVYSYHVHSNGWSDIGYNFLIDRFGTVYEGRYGGVTKPVVGAHAGGFNTATFGVSLMGCFDASCSGGGATPSKATKRALRRLLAWKYDVHHTNVLGSTNYYTYGSTKYSAGTVKMPRLAGHRDASLTACPGRPVYELLPKLRTQVADLQGPVILNPTASPQTIEVVNGSSVSGAVRFGMRLRPAGAWTLKVRDPGGTLVHAATGYDKTMAYDWVPVGMSPGSYTYTLSSPDRRAARGTITVRSPKISASVSPTSATIDDDGTLRTPMAFAASLYEGARWRLRITDPAGTVVRKYSGTGSSMNRQWSGPATTPGTYTWRLASDDVTPVTGAVQLYADRIGRLGVPTTSAAAAAGISKATFGSLGAGRAVLARGDGAGYALSAGALVGRAGPVLYTGSDQLPDATLAELQRVLPEGRKIFVLGGKSVISDAALAGLDRWKVERVAGGNPTAVAAAAADIVVARTGSRTAVVVGASAWRQGVAGASFATRAGHPVLLTGKAELSPATAASITRNGLREAVVVGDRDAVSDTAAAQLPPHVRVGPGDPAATATGVARRLWGRTAAADGDAFIFANVGRGDGWARALAAVPLAARQAAPLLVTGTSAVPAPTQSYLDRLGFGPTVLGRGWVVGNADHVSASTRTTLSRHLQ